MHDYADEYCNYTAYGDIVVQQRLQMVHWIVEVSAYYFLIFLLILLLQFNLNLFRNSLELVKMMIII